MACEIEVGDKVKLYGHDSKKIYEIRAKIVWQNKEGYSLKDSDGQVLGGVFKTSVYKV